MIPHHATGLRGRHGRSPLFTLAVLTGLALGLGPAAAGDRAGTSDVLLARSALAALDADPQLRDANLVVSVVDRVAVVGGPVRTAEAGERAAWLVRNVRGIAEVKNRCFVQAGADPLIRMVADRMGTNRPPVPELPPIVPGPRTGTAAAPPTAAWDTFRPATPTEPPAKEVVSLRPATPPLDSVLMAPVGPHGSVAPALTPPPARPAPAVVTGRPRC